MDNLRFKQHIDRVFSLMENHSDSDTKCAIIKTIMSCLSKCNDSVISELCTCIEGMSTYYNYLTEKEASAILNSFKNYDGSTGSPLSMSILDQMESQNKCIDNAPYFNKYALFVTMCKFASDQGSIIKRLVNDDTQAYYNICYEMAVSQLKDNDRPRWVRYYFNLF